MAITLLALDLGRVHAQPGVGDGTLNAALERYWPTLLAFAASFAFIGVAWTNHHNVFVRVARMSRGLNAANLLLLAGITLVPWATSSLADALSQPGKHGQQEVLLYAAVLMFGTATWSLVFHTLATHPELLVDPNDARGFRADRLGILIGLGPQRWLRLSASGGPRLPRHCCSWLFRCFSPSRPKDSTGAPMTPTSSSK